MSFYEQPQRILSRVKVGYMALTLVLALVFNLLPWRDVIGLPDMLALVLTFWCVHQPRKMGIGIAWFVGLLMDAGQAAPVLGAGRFEVRGTLLNLDHLDEIQPWPGGRLLVRVKDGKRTELEVARDRVQALKERLGI